MPVRAWMENIASMSPSDKHTVDLVGMMSIVGVFADLLPVLVLFFTLIWTIIRIYETDTVQRLIHGRKDDGEGS